MHQITLPLMLTLCVSQALSPSAAQAAQDHWSRFRGPRGAGVVADERPLPERFDAETRLLWRTAIGAGHSSPCLFGDRIFITGVREGELETLCIERSSGEVLWGQVLPMETPERRVHETNSLASPTATADAQRVYVYFGSLGLVCYDHGGQELWRRELPAQPNLFGTAASPILAAGKLILARDTQADSSLEAMDPASGKTLWKVDRKGFDSGWSTPVVRQAQGVQELLVFGKWWLTAYDLSDGSQRWSVPGLSDEPIVTPVMGEGLVFVSSYNMGTNTEVLGLPAWEVLLQECDSDGDGKLTPAEAQKNTSILSRADADGQGDHPLAGFFRFLDKDKNGELVASEWQGIFDWLGGFEHLNALVAIRPGSEERSAEIVWQHAKGVPECPSPLYYKGRIYLVKNGGTFSCLDAKTGELKYQGRTGARGPIYGSPVAGDDKIYCASKRGVISVLQAGDTLKVLALNDLGEEIMSTPALAEGKVYVRAAEHLYAFGEAD